MMKLSKKAQTAENKSTGWLVLFLIIDKEKEVCTLFPYFL